VLATVGAQGDWRAIRDEYIDADAPPSTPLGELDARWWERRRPRVDPPA
jgi:hypothetical protein